jgi:hypothetical protein
MHTLREHILRECSLSLRSMRQPTERSLKRRDIEYVKDLLGDRRLLLKKLQMPEL